MLPSTTDKPVISTLVKPVSFPVKRGTYHSCRGQENLPLLRVKIAPSGQ